VKSNSYGGIALCRILAIFALGVILGFSGGCMKIAKDANSERWCVGALHTTSELPKLI
jgi:hypothetical protein